MQGLVHYGQRGLTELLASQSKIIWVKSAPRDFWDNNFVPLGQELCPK